MKVSGERLNTNKTRKTTQKPIDSENSTDEDKYEYPTISGSGIREIFIETWIFDGNFTKKYTKFIILSKEK